MTRERFRSAHRLTELGNVFWIPILSLIGLLAYATIIGYLHSQPASHQDVNFTLSTISGDTYTVTLTSIDHNAKQMNFDLETILPANQKTAQRCIAFEHYSPDGRSGGSSYKTVTMNEVLIDSQSAHDPPEPNYAMYRGSGQFRFDSGQRRFPFDEVPLRIYFHSMCGSVPTDIAQNLFVRNRIQDYQLSPTGPQSGITQIPDITLQRSPFLIALAVVLFLVAFVSALVIIIDARTDPPDLKLLTYFVGLWGIRSVLLTPIKDVTVFPTLVEVTILFLFGFTVIGIGLMRFLATRTKPQKTDWSRF